MITPSERVLFFEQEGAYFRVYTQFIKHDSMRGLITAKNVRFPAFLLTSMRPKSRNKMS
jgi:hypothetical protein